MLHPMSPMGQNWKRPSAFAMSGLPLEADVRRANRHPLRAAHRRSADQLTHLAVAGWLRDQSTLSRRSSVAIEDKNQQSPQTAADSSPLARRRRTAREVRPGGVRNNTDPPRPA